MKAIAKQPIWNHKTEQLIPQYAEFEEAADFVKPLIDIQMAEEVKSTAKLTVKPTEVSGS